MWLYAYKQTLGSELIVKLVGQTVDLRAKRSSDGMNGERSTAELAFGNSNKQAAGQAEQVFW